MAYADLESACDAAVRKYHEFADRTKANSERMKEISELQKHIGTYGKTREIYAQYRRLPPKKQRRILRQTTPAPLFPARRRSWYFDGLGLKKLPLCPIAETGVCHPTGGEQ